MRTRCLHSWTGCAFGLLISGLTLVAAMLGALLFSQRVVTTLKNLSLSARRIAEGNLQRRVG